MFKDEFVGLARFCKRLRFDGTRIKRGSVTQKPEPTEFPK